MMRRNLVVVFCVGVAGYAAYFSILAFAPGPVGGEEPFAKKWVDSIPATWTADWQQSDFSYRIWDGAVFEPAPLSTNSETVWDEMRPVPPVKLSEYELEVVQPNMRNYAHKLEKELKVMAKGP